MDIQDIKGWLDASKTALELLKAAIGVLPKGVKREEIEAKVHIAEEALRKSDAKAAKDLGYQLCTCTFPPQIMLWKEAESAHVCPNVNCGRKIKKGGPASVALGSRFRGGRGGGDDWMMR